MNFVFTYIYTSNNFVGHILGIEHTLLPGNIMFPYYEEGVKRLGSQDLHSFNMIYTKNYSG